MLIQQMYFANRKFLFRRLTYFLIFFLLPKYLLAAPPYITDDADVTEHKHIQYYLYANPLIGTDATYLALPGGEVDYGFIKNGEIGLVVQGFSYIPSEGDSTFGLSDTQVKLKYIVLNETQSMPEISIAPSVNLPTGSVPKNLGWGKTWYVLPVWLEKRWGAWTTYGGGGYTINSAANAKNFPFAGWVLQRDVTEKLALGFEVYGQGAIGDQTVPVSGAFKLINVGAAYQIDQSTTFLFSIGHSFSGIQVWDGYIGFNIQL